MTMTETTPEAVLRQALRRRGLPLETTSVQVHHSPTTDTYTYTVSVVTQEDWQFIQSFGGIDFGTRQKALDVLIEVADKIAHQYQDRRNAHMSKTQLLPKDLLEDLESTDRTRMHLEEHSRGRGPVRSGADRLPLTLNDLALAGAMIGQGVPAGTLGQAQSAWSQNTLLNQQQQNPFQSLQGSISLGSSNSITGG